MLSLQSIKPILAMAGINNLSVKFEPENRLIRAAFDRGGQHFEEIISFEQIEALFTDSREGTQETLQQLNARGRIS